MKTIVVSDLHLGVDDRIAEFVKNRSLFIEFMELIRRERKVDEVVINGDFLDQWFYPGDMELTGDSDTFYREVAKNNQSVVESMKALITDGIRLVYVPGNHDMTLSTKTLADIIPGILQVRDVRGLGRYRTGERGETVIEHSHRYEIFCAPDPFSNKEWVSYGEPILPPGYFYSRLGVTSLLENFPKVTKKLPQVQLMDNTDDQKAAYIYFKTWEQLVNEQFPVKEDFKERFIKVSVDGFSGEFSIADLVPAIEGNEITAKMYRNIQRNWDEIQRRNLVPAPSSAIFELQHVVDQETRIMTSKSQYFDLDPTVDVVVFGHTHLAAYREFTEGYDAKKIFANSGTWVDNNFDDVDNTATFVEIDSSATDDKVEVKKCIGEGKLQDIVLVNNQYICR